MAYEEGCHWAILQIWSMYRRLIFKEECGETNHLYYFKVIETGISDKERMGRLHKLLEGPIKWFQEALNVLFTEMIT